MRKILQFHSYQFVPVRLMKDFFVLFLINVYFFVARSTGWFIGELMTTSTHFNIRSPFQQLAYSAHL